MVELPDLTGEHIEDAQEILKDLKLQSRAEAIETDEQKPDHVVEQSARGLVEQGSSITLRYAEEPPPEDPEPDPTDTESPPPEPDPEPTDPPEPEDTPRGHIPRRGAFRVAQQLVDARPH